MRSSKQPIYDKRRVLLVINVHEKCLRKWPLDRGKVSAGDSRAKLILAEFRPTQNDDVIRKVKTIANEKRSIIENN